MTDLNPIGVLTPQYQRVQSQIEMACEHAQLSRESVQLLAVSKKHDIDKIQQIYKLGQRSFGENYVQEGVEKVQALHKLDIQWHFIGPIQSNKSRLVAEHFDWVHALDREKLAKRLNEQRPSNLSALNVLIQVNISEEDSKSGVSINDIKALANSISNMKNLKLRGLMCIPAKLNENELRKEFIEMRDQFLELQKNYPQVDTLSMGMSGDLAIAIECGSTLVRVGSAIFGQRV